MATSRPINLDPAPRRRANSTILHHPSVDSVPASPIERRPPFPESVIRGLGALSIPDSVYHYPATASVLEQSPQVEAEFAQKERHEGHLHGLLTEAGAHLSAESVSGYSQSIAISDMSHATTIPAAPITQDIDYDSCSSSPPSLIDPNSSTSTLAASSVDTADADALEGQELLHIGEEEGLLVRYPEHPRSRTTLECTFWFLRCSYSSNNIAEWETHCLSHFRMNPPPKQALCPACNAEKKCDTGEEAWQWRMEHIAKEHDGQSARGSQFDRALFKHLWNKKLISNQQLKELNTNGQLTIAPSQSYTVTEGSRSERVGRPSGIRRAI